MSLHDLPTLETPRPDSALESHFARFRERIVGDDATFESPYGTMPLVYADWVASGRLYRPIEEHMLDLFGPMVGNTHTESSVTGTTMTRAYHEAQRILKAHVNAGPDDAIIMSGSGMTGAISKFQRILGLRVPDLVLPRVTLRTEERPVVFVTHMEHHSNHTSWMESLADVVVLPSDDAGLVDPESLRRLIVTYTGRPLLIGSFTACSNVTGITTPYHDLARIMHEHGGYCFVDFAASAPYVAIDMHPADPMAALDAVFFSPHKFLGGPGTPGALIFTKRLYRNRVPDHPGGGTVNWTNPWGVHSFIEDIEAREDGGTPAFLQTMRAALAVRLKEEMGVEAIHAREQELLATAFRRLRAIPGLHILADAVEDRLGIVSFYVEGIHYNLIVRLLNDRFGIQVRGGCSCAGTYGHYLLHVDQDMSNAILDQILNHHDLSAKPGWVRLSLHPTLTNARLDYILDAIDTIVKRIDAWKADYTYVCSSNEFLHKDDAYDREQVEGWFNRKVESEK
ncbi:MAG: aminotransferase class V-fold PLP-dependent enzyme [Rhodothermales bacterium]|nr:aminotransferase class V-fold PLP-dependent enzyme [Rhodothermales bacterium]